MARAQHKFRGLWVNRGGEVAEQALQYLQVLFRIEDELAAATTAAQEQVRQRKSRRVAAALNNSLLTQ